MYAIDLFCGAGGFSEGILQAGFHIVFSSDRSPYVQKTYTNRHEQLGLVQGENTHFELADIRDLHSDEILKHINELNFFKKKKKKIYSGDIDAIFGGPPCQGFSVAGKRDKKDPRNMLFREYLRVIRDIRPKYVVMENVTGFLSMEVNPDFKSFNKHYYEEHSLVQHVVKKELEGFGYNVLEPKILNASDYGVPQNRQRAIFLAYRDDVSPINYPDKKENEKISVLEALKDISVNEKSLNEGIPAEYSKESQYGRTPHFVNKKPISHYGSPLNMEESTHSKLITERFSLFKPGESTSQVKTRLLDYKLAGEIVINFDALPTLLLHTTLNLNKENNMWIFNQIINKNVENIPSSPDIKEKFVKSFYKKIIKIWNFPIESKEFELIAKQPISNIKVPVETMRKVFQLSKNMMNKYIKSEEVSNWFSNVNYEKEPRYYEVTNDDGSITVMQHDPGQLSLFYTIGKNDELTWNEIMNAVFTNKNTRSRLNGHSQSPTMVTLPDDFIHPTKNKILNVREMARIQSFDDSFEFLGKRTTGGTKRKDEVPQFTQVGNAVPPLLAYAIAKEVKNALAKTASKNAPQR